MNFKNYISKREIHIVQLMVDFEGLCNFFGSKPDVKDCHIEKISPDDNIYIITYTDEITIENNDENIAKKWKLVDLQHAYYKKYGRACPTFDQMDKTRDTTTKFTPEIFHNGTIVTQTTPVNEKLKSDINDKKKE